MDGKGLSYWGHYPGGCGRFSKGANRLLKCQAGNYRIPSAVFIANPRTRMSRRFTGSGASANPSNV